MGFGLWGEAFGVEGLGLIVWCEVEDFGLEVEVLRFRVSDLGFGVLC